MATRQPTIPPSKVLHIRNGSPEPNEVDLTVILPFLSNFGTVIYVVTMPKLQQALVEMDTLESAQKAVSYATSSQIEVQGQLYFLHFSKSQSINREPSYRRTLVEHHGEKILLATVHNPLYPITMDIVTAILKPFNVLRIVIFHTHGIQFLAEFATPEEARTAKDALDGREIYSNCCLLKVVYSTQSTTLNVRFNTDMTYDFTRPDLPTKSA
ncbi:heterogeneous nuclear ribonucleoprotein L-like [Monocercomonoides exilis]|uniref:heterogeneous nuclear ribonucleoprotein L-like n=1 Tax=Monocercomonoides exilis TaxID=2049356 RepID=UPI00355A273A|nr:heterogeneous nuclear ribonucleoprotein L-like [Monocercomonoides exilis]|eukprot:MONOS_5679.1-p1 / transcript=MONOS_5679.1 / gene=MONOS_5679 / organism=Monocercomonoides_exilis_PA203 / gene_product=heterogeneous nuclear ribonucleoprotein L-like / transcript_product=heterogeneous nuclear ribonucleoprotein L-like / location=Mono_scaffold00168:52210-52904(+) / protein_length=212 / sequence_SO=supercontig / SO=protein_coding / is_pseudo=false